MDKNFFDIEYAHRFFADSNRSSQVTVSTIGADDLAAAALKIMNNISKMHSTTVIKRVEIKVNNKIRRLHGPW